MSNAGVDARAFAGMSYAESVAPKARHLTASCNLCTLVLLNGSIRRANLGTWLGRSVLDLPVDGSGQTVMDVWLGEIMALCQQQEIWNLPVRIVTDNRAVVPKKVHGGSRVVVRAEIDPVDLRGTGGVLRDLAAEYEDDQVIVVANAAQLPTVRLAEIVEDLLSDGADAAVVSHEDGSPSGLMVMKCGCLRHLPATGFIDMKEQGLQLIAARHRVAVRQYDQPTGLSIRTLGSYISAMHWWHRQTGEPQADFLKENWQRSFGVVEPGASVHYSAVIHDSVVLEGGRVEAGAVVVRSVVAPSGAVRSDRIIMDAVVRSNKL